MLVDWRTTAAAALVLLAGGCGSEDRGEGPEVGAEVAVVDSGGVAVVEDTAMDRPADRSAVRLRELRPPDSALVAMPWGVGADPETGRIYALDRPTPRVVVFDGSGEYVETLGREGGGRASSGTRRPCRWNRTAP